MTQSQNDSLIGMQLDEYRLEELLGRGGMARVYRALDVRLNRYAAIKVIDTPYRSDTEYVRRFEREAQAIARLEHPNVVRLYRYGEVEGLLYIAMQYVQGATLAYVMDSYRMDGEYIPPDEALRITAEVGQALDYIHSQGIIHRDIKPANILLTGEETTGVYHAVLTDFGLVLLTEMGTRGEIFGTPHYIAPEQAISSARAVPQSDLYSLGVILYEMFTGVLPFNASDPMDVALLHMSEPPPAPREIRAELSPAVEAVLLKMLEKQPQDRYPSGKALHLALTQALLSGQAVSMPSRLSVPQRVSEGISARPLPPLPAAVTPPKPPVNQPAQEITALEDPQTNGVANLTGKESGPESDAQPDKRSSIDKEPLIPQPASTVEQAVGARRVAPEEAKPARKVLPTVRMADATPMRVREDRTADGTAYPANMGQPEAMPIPPVPAVGTGKRSRLALWLGLALLAIFALACFLSGVLVLYNRMIAGGGTSQLVESTATAVAGAQVTQAAERPTQIEQRPTLEDPGMPVKTATPTAASPTYSLLFGRCQKNGCLLIKNEGNYPVLMSNLVLKVKKDSIQGSEWGIELLLPGDCVRAVAGEEWLNQMPDHFTCGSTSGHPLLKEGKDVIWKDTFSIQFAGKNAGECKKNQTSCSIQVKK